MKRSKIKLNPMEENPIYAQTAAQKEVSKSELLTLKEMPFGKSVLRVAGQSVGMLCFTDTTSEDLQATIKFSGTLEIVAAEDVASLDNGQEIISKILGIPYCKTC